MMTRWLVLVCVVAMTLLSIKVGAHHPFAAAYVEDREITITGQVVQFLFRDPHSFLQLKVVDQRKVSQIWSVEWIGRTLLTAQGVSITTLKPGETVIATGSPGRSEAEYRLRLKVLTRTKDHWEWHAPALQMGTVRR